MRPASAMQRLKLSLASPLFYRSRTMSLDEAIARADSEAPGYDAAIICRYSCSDDGAHIAGMASGERPGYTEDERRMIESGIMPERKAGEDLMIPAGEYLFMQLPYIPEEKEIPRIILPCITAQEGTFYIRIFKESILECVIQLLFPTY